ncbi:hypothetical protein C8C77_12821 [Halanaerobium saccharolyticum]|uniref:Uncharacterized protein n=1 Tax=Halanaerobium saccharolyticum TaxID=43595 RepID=A0A4R7YWC1_9FIRM|nr:hypothetical protein [Halanaerobium saccharolyticum]RAK10250.1 hypothetical protein C7958_10521 [Halanaerobium saccharolyticum]TDW00462.1 hypothetical protein C8C77_12821 [Halanaerobium saccharolyticum]TDX52047.1 hypothetical protein C7956_12721 [Halanaerobium saccharolyticum]
MEYIIRKIKAEDWEGVRGIYLEGIKTGNSTFQVQAPDWKERDAGHYRQVFFRKIMLVYSYIKNMLLEKLG